VEIIQAPMGNARKVSKRIRILRRKYLSVHGEYGNLGLFTVYKIVSECAESIYLNAFGEYAERIYAYMEKTQRDSWRILQIRQEI
jgi:hypothetical protein